MTFDLESLIAPALAVAFAGIGYFFVSLSWRKLERKRYYTKTAQERAEAYEKSQSKKGGRVLENPKEDASDHTYHAAE